MATPPKDGKLIYHLTSLENLKGIFTNGLSSRNELNNFDDVAEQEIILHRNAKGLNGFVPFHFFAGNPFDGAVQNAHPKKDFVFIALQRNFAISKNFSILTQHPLSIPNEEPLTYLEGFDKIDWITMELRDYSDHFCREICMAECLSPTKVNPNDFFKIFTKSEEVKNIVVELRDKLVGKDSFYVDSNQALFRK